MGKDCDCEKNEVVQGIIEETVKQTMGRKRWSAVVKEMIGWIEEEEKEFEECKGNKLCKAKLLRHLFVALNRSMKGWSTWLSFDHMDKLEESEMDWLYEKLKPIIIEFLTVDKEISKKKEDETIEAVKKEAIEMYKKDKEKIKEDDGEQSKSFYVS